MQLHEEIEKMACLKLTFCRKNLINRVTFSKFAACVQKQIGNFKKLQKNVCSCRYTYEPNMDKPQDVKRKCLGYVFGKM